MATDSPAKEISEHLGHGHLAARDGRIFKSVLTELREVRARGGWMHFVLTVRDQHERTARTSLMAGIISGGGRGVMPWIEGRISQSLEFADGRTLDARAAGLEDDLVRLIGELIPAGGHLMIEYESADQSETHRGLLLRVPPAATHLGAMMFAAGFRGLFKDWYISEGGHEGPRKLQANKSPNPAAAGEALRSHVAELEQFIARPLPENAEDAVLIARAQDRARFILKELGSKTG